MDIRLRAEFLGRTQEEIRFEMASSLGRITSTFQQLLKQLQEMEASKDSAGDQKYRQVLQDARLYYWYLIVQRESIGLRDHRHIHKEYRIPASVLLR